MWTTVFISGQFHILPKLCYAKFNRELWLSGWWLWFGAKVVLTKKVS